MRNTSITILKAHFQWIINEQEHFRIKCIPFSFREQNLSTRSLEVYMERGVLISEVFSVDSLLVHVELAPHIVLYVGMQHRL